MKATTTLKTKWANLVCASPEGYMGFAYECYNYGSKMFQYYPSVAWPFSDSHTVIKEGFYTFFKVDDGFVRLPNENAGTERNEGRFQQIFRGNLVRAGFINQLI